MGRSTGPSPLGTLTSLRLTAAAATAAAVLVLLLSGAARAATTTAVTTKAPTAAVATKAAATTTTAASNTPVLVSSLTKPPAGYRLTAGQVLRTARANPKVRAELRRHPRATPYEYTKGPGQWQVSWFSATKPQRELLQVYVDDVSGHVTEVWTGFQVAWTMARGYPGAFGRRVNTWYLWAALSILFVAPFLPLPGLRRRRWEVLDDERGLDGTLASDAHRRRPPLLVLDLLMLLGFSISLGFFNHAQIGLSVPLVYPFLIYGLVRMLLLANGRGLPSRPLSVNVPITWLGIGTVFLMAFRIGLNVLNSNVIDVGYAGVIGATKLLHGQALYGHWPADNRYGDTYGPFSYLAYVPFRLIFGWSGRWDSLPAAHAAAIGFDVLTLGLLYLLGRRLRGPSLGIVLAYLWAAYPFTLWAMNSNTNDGLVAATVVGALLVLTSAPARGVMALLAGVTKFAPLALAPLLWRGTDERPRVRSLIAFGLAFAAAAVVVMLPVLAKSDLGPFWRDSVQYQSERVTPFSVWGLWGGLGALQHLLQGAVIALALGVAFLPERRGTMEVAALGAAVLIALQLTLNYWLYPYIVWFFPMVIVALAAAHPGRRAVPESGPEPTSVFEADDRAAIPIPIRISSA